jgi:hypothetical protein
MKHLNDEMFYLLYMYIYIHRYNFFLLSFEIQRSSGMFAIKEILLFLPSSGYSRDARG